MRRILRRFAPDPTIIIGSDIPEITVKHLRQAFETLAQNQAVFGPALDGGYWAIGTRGMVSRQQGFLEKVRWSSDQALSDTINSLGGARYGLIETLGDVDTAADLKAQKNPR